uniref:Cytochrome P450 CYP3-like member 3 n=1 Tax=Ciona intestinalis TaxID=7719 RepID=Q0GBX2_CIOIN|nr:cytochrome P450 CYP3-like member 3 [Ciona intestinalis]ABI20700.1 cytochrome P450 CYP3-like member 3 [Ciona intestinalis]|eukprot:NP_001122348.1 cytochrome P450 CYP3-like member 3 [Ciona intestinalis]
MITPLDILSLETWILILTSFILIRLYIHKRWQVLKDLNIPHDPPTILGVGNMSKFFKDSDAGYKRHLELKQKFGPIYGHYIGLSPHVYVGDPEILKQIMIKEFHIFPDRQRNFQNANGKEFNDNLTAISGKQWKRVRDTLSPTFTSSKLKEMFGIVEDCADSFVQNIGTINSDDDGRFQPAVAFSKVALDSICSAAFGVNVDSQSKPQGQEPEVVKMALKLFNYPVFKNPFFLIFLMFPWTEQIAKVFDYSLLPKDCLRYFARLAKTVKKNKTNVKQRVDIMQTLINSEITDNDVKNGATKGLTEIEVTANSLLMMFGGFETTASAMVFLAYNLAVYKDAQHKCREEIEQVIAKHGGLTYEAMNDLKYLMQCLNESLRLYPPAPMNSRYCERDITIHGLTIKKGITVQIPVYGMGRDEEFWEDPLVFKPERMLDMNEIDPMIFQPFGAGPRNCIGMRFALLEIKISFAKLLQKFHLDVCEDTPAAPIDVSFKSGMRTKQDLFLKVTARE